MAAPLNAIHVTDFAEFRARKIRGSFHVVAPDEEGALTFWCCCPCGCGSMVSLLAGRGVKPAAGPSWEWNGSLTAATLTPSVLQIGHWHGRLRDGVWTPWKQK